MIPATEKQKQAVIHALRETLNRVKQGNGNQYGPLTLSELEEYLDSISPKGKDDPIGRYFRGDCPECGNSLDYNVTYFCPRCRKPWTRDKVFERFQK